jgi:hypothetical protein
VVAETSQFADHLASPHFLRLGTDRRPALVQDLPDQSTQPVGDGTRRRVVLAEIRRLVVRMAEENPTGATRGSKAR